MGGGKEGRGLERFYISFLTVLFMLGQYIFLFTFFPALYIFTFICTCLFGARCISGKEEVGYTLAQS